MCWVQQVYAAAATPMRSSFRRALCGEHFFVQAPIGAIGQQVQCQPQATIVPMTPGLLSLFLLAALAGSSGRVHAEKADRTQPMNIEADALRHDEPTRTSVFSGHVVLTQGSIVLRGARLAVAVAAAMKAHECLIYTDVDGVYTTDPRVVPQARRLQTVSFEEMLEMASLGSKVLQIRSVEFAGKYRVRLRVLSSFTPWDMDIDEEARSGTLITFEEDEKMEQAVVSGIAFNRDEAKLSVLGVPDKPGAVTGPVAAAGR
ncbi:hypothetical protein ET532_028165 [Verminephrobacter sp. Larva24]|nr:hypothetical protein ET532_028165 [Verminephrobacter sp. Larva24]